jgi:hypothetical protein
MLGSQTDAEDAHENANDLVDRDHSGNVTHSVT